MKLFHFFYIMTVPSINLRTFVPRKLCKHEFLPVFYHPLSQRARFIKHLSIRCKQYKTARILNNCIQMVNMNLQYLVKNCANKIATKLRKREIFLSLFFLMPIYVSNFVINFFSQIHSYIIIFQYAF